MPASGLLAPSGISGVASREPSGQLAGAPARLSTPLDFGVPARGLSSLHCIPRRPVSRRVRRPAPPETTWRSRTAPAELGAASAVIPAAASRSSPGVPPGPHSSSLLGDVRTGGDPPSRPCRASPRGTRKASTSPSARPVSGASVGEEMWWTNLSREKPYSADELKSLPSEVLREQLLERFGGYYEPILVSVPRSR
jgi:hypothetical protein